tara:strand:+ start:57 stop:266 length:210 start_codon:yes stop_codon:yes gene_type:complete
MNYQEDETVKVTCTDNGNVADGVIIKDHPNGDKTIIVEKTIKMVFKKYRGNVWICEMRGREYVYDSRVS